MKMASTCSFSENTVPMEEYLVKLWSKICRKNERFESNEFCTTEPLWDYKYLEALVSLTECIGCKFSNSADLGQVLHVMSTRLDSCNAEITVLLFDVFCSLYYHRKKDDNERVIDSIFKNALKILLQGVEASVKSYILNVLSKYRNVAEFQEFVSTILHEDDLRNTWKLNCDMRDKTKCNSTEWRELLAQSANNEFHHKCSSDRSIKSIKLQFDLGDFMSDIEEPPAKKKRNCEKLDDIVERLENDTVLLSLVQDVTLSDDYKKRIADVIDKLGNIVS